MLNHQFRIKPTSDAEHVRQLARSIDFWDRWRWVMFAIFGLLLVSFIFFFRLLANFAQGLIGLGVNVNQLYLLIAFMLGTTFGMHLHSFLGYIVNAALGGYRTERMLVSLYAENEEDEVKAE